MVSAFYRREPEVRKGNDLLRGMRSLPRSTHAFHGGDWGTSSLGHRQTGLASVSVPAGHQGQGQRDGHCSCCACCWASFSPSQVLTLEVSAQASTSSRKPSLTSPPRITHQLGAPIALCSRYSQCGLDQVPPPSLGLPAGGAVPSPPKPQGPHRARQGAPVGEGLQSRAGCPAGQGHGSGLHVTG